MAAIPLDALKNVLTSENQIYPQYDLVCIGFGPASLAIAIALHDRGINPRVLYIEKQRSFIWHAGMLLPDARMQISFLKDLATLRDPTSHFTFINYLKSKNRLVAFTNLSTFLPLREEYNDYMSWCASHFESKVQYGHETTSVSAISNQDGPIDTWNVTSRNTETNQSSTVTARSVVIAIGGKPRIPIPISGLESRVVHSSSYSTAVPKILQKTYKPHSVAVVGGGQSSAEIFNDLQSRYPNSSVTLFTGASALKPSDDSPFVNEIFDPERVDDFYELPSESRQQSTLSNKATNYGVVRPELLDRLYEAMYQQRLHEPDQNNWQFKIVPWRGVVGFEKASDSDRIRLRLKNTSTGEMSISDATFDLAILGTGYERKGHETLLDSTRPLLQEEKFAVERNYRVKYRKDAVAEDSGIWLQGCCEDTHGLGDTLLSMLAVRGGEMVDSIFGSRTRQRPRL
ncbi:MAG: hypothetical protein Q9166_007715 [cf. Caloplaca sp. 2 TL-2023]